VTDHFITARDGTQIFVADRGPISTEITPILCLPGLTRNSKDFEPVFEIYSNTRRVIAIDLRGRGRSQYADPKTYTVANELDDVIMVLNALNIKRVALVGTSRGGLIGQVMAATHHDRLAGLLLNDIGPELNPVGLKRILSSIGTQTTFKDWDDAALNLATSSHGFNHVTHKQWLMIAKRIFTLRETGPCTDYDPLLTRDGLSVADVDAGKLQNLWGLTPSLKDIPVAVLRGESSDLLSADTIEKMHAILPELKSMIVHNRGHVPFLDEPESLSLIQVWLEVIDQKEKGRREAGLLK
jgi:pimeloyl-ACP methyl ester carboxylesterase